MLRVREIDLCGETRPLFYMETDGQTDMIRRVFGGETLVIPRRSEPITTVVDIGANIGVTTLYWRENFPDARILSFEPDKEAYALLDANTRGLANVEVFDFGLFDKSCDVTLYKGVGGPETSSIMASKDTREVGDLISLRAAGEALDTLEVNQIDVLKIDTEGCELPILQNLRHLLENVYMIFLEFHSASDRLAIDRLLEDSHYLCACTVFVPHRGELAYVNRNHLRSIGGHDYMEIRID